MSYQEDTIDWQAVEFVDRWLDGAVADNYQQQPLAQDWARISKVQEELGEAIQCFIGYTGQNLRKGVINDLDDVLEELADTLITALFAMHHFTKNGSETRQLIRDKIQKIYERAAAAGPMPSNEKHFQPQLPMCGKPSNTAEWPEG